MSVALAFANLGVSALPDINYSADAATYISGSNDTTGATNSTTGSWTPTPAGLICVFVQSSRVGGPDTPAVGGNSLTWTQIGSTLNAGSGRGLTLFAADATGATTGATTISFGANTQLACIASFTQVTAGVDLSGGVAGAFVQQVQNGATANATAPTLTLAAAGNPANRPLACFFHVIQEATNARANWTKGDDLQGSAYPRGLMTEWRADAFETTASASWTTGSGWGGMAVEIKAIPPPIVVAVANTLRATSKLEMSMTMVDSDLIGTNSFITTAHSNMTGLYARLRSFIGGFGQSDPLQFWDGTGTTPTLNQVIGGQNVFTTAGVDAMAANAVTLGIPIDWIIWRLPWQFTTTIATGLDSTAADYFGTEGRVLRSNQRSNFMLYMRRLGGYLMATYGSLRYIDGSEMKGFQTNSANWDYAGYFSFYADTLTGLSQAAADNGLTMVDASGVGDVAVGGPYPVLSHKGGSVTQTVVTDTLTTATAPVETYRTKDSATPATWSINQPIWGNLNQGPVKATAEWLKLCAANSVTPGMYSTDFALYNNDNVIKSADDFACAEQETRDVLRWSKRLLQDIAGGQFAYLQNMIDITEYYMKPQGTIAPTPNNHLVNGDGSAGANPPGPYLPSDQWRRYFGALKAIGLAVCVEEGARSPSWWSCFGRADGRTAPILFEASNNDDQRFYGEHIVHKGGTGDGGAGEGTLTVVGQIIKWFNSYFPAGTPVYNVSVSDPSKVYAIANLTTCILINKTGVSQDVTVNSLPFTLAPYDTQAITYQQAYGGTVALTLPHLTLAASGTYVAAAYNAVAVLTLPSLTLAASGTYVVTTYNGIAALTLPSLTLAASGTFNTPGYTGTAVLSLPSLGISAAGDFVPPAFSGAGTLTLPSLTLTAAGLFGLPAYTGSVRATLPSLTVSASGNFVIPAYQGTAILTLPSFSIVLSGDFRPPVVSGTMALLLPMLIVAASGRTSVAGGPIYVEVSVEVYAVRTADISITAIVIAEAETIFMREAIIEL